MINESRINEIIKRVIDEAVVSQFTPYTEDEKERNFKALRGEFGRSLEDRNPAYAKALKAAQERMKNKNKNKATNCFEFNIFLYIFAI